MSNYTSKLTPTALAAWRDVHDVGLVIVQAVDPPTGYPHGVTREQIEACAAVDMPTDVYLYLWVQSNVEADMRAKLGLLSGLEQHVGRVWLDVEDTVSASVEARVTAIRQGLAVVDGWCQAHEKPLAGLYTANWWWQPYLADTEEFSDRDLWCAQYDQVEDAAVFEPFGGWQTCQIKQYLGSSMLAGIGGVDLNIRA